MKDKGKPQGQNGKKKKKHDFQHSSIHKRCSLNSSQSYKLSVSIIHTDDVKKAILSYLQKRCLIISCLHAFTVSLDIFYSLYLSLCKIFKTSNSFNETWYKKMFIISYQFIKHKAYCICIDYSQMLVEISIRTTATFVTSNKEIRCLGVRVRNLIFPM